jgi:DNA polymerase-3 subunit epsilon
MKQVFDRADAAHRTRVGAGLGPLPDWWRHGEPSRVGDRVAWTGCDETQRPRLEGRVKELGVRFISSVSRLTVMLITDESFAGGKLAKAQQLGTRHVHPDGFDVLLRHPQPARNAATQSVAPLGAVQPLAAGPAAAWDGSPSSTRAWAAASGYEAGVRGAAEEEAETARQRREAEARTAAQTLAPPGRYDDEVPF